jgi:hypothetical protein
VYAVQNNNFIFIENLINIQAIINMSFLRKLNFIFNHFDRICIELKFFLYKYFIFILLYVCGQVNNLNNVACFKNFFVDKKEMNY